MMQSTNYKIIIGINFKALFTEPDKRGIQRNLRYKLRNTSASESFWGVGMAFLDVADGGEKYSMAVKAELSFF